MQTQIENDLRHISEGIAAAQGAKANLRYERRYPTLVNSPSESELAVKVATKVVGEPNVDADIDPIMGSEDFALMLKSKPGCYVLLGNGVDGGTGGVPAHNPYYDFNDDALVIGASYWTRLAETALA